MPAEQYVPLITSRQRFEYWFTNGDLKSPAIERAGDAYKFLATCNAWRTWQACVDSAIRTIDQCDTLDQAARALAEGNS